MQINKQQWEEAYSSDSIFHKNKYHSELVISFVKRNYSSKIRVDNRKEYRVLDFGCGWENNLRYLKEEGFDAYGIDLSETAINSLKFEFGNNVCVSKELKLPCNDSFFDFIIDKSSIQHNPKNDIKEIHKELYRVLKKENEMSKFFSVMLAEGDNGFLTGFLTEKEIKDSLSMFGNVCIMY